jgi:hypothetical protein
MGAGKLMIIAGVALVTIGLIVSYLPGLLGWFGRLPGDIRVEGENKFFFFPFTSMLIISVILTVIVNVFFRR